MNKPLFSFLAIAFFISTLFGTAIARERSYGGKCLYLNEQEEEQDFKSCQVNIQQKTLEINFESEKYRDHNQTIMGKSVREIASGEYAQKLLSDSGSAVSGILLGPINVVGKIFAPDKDYQQYIITYKKPEGDETITILNIDRSDAPEFQQELSLITGKLITFQPGQTETTINIGPDVEDIKPGN
ncbi:hypothetical protein [Myxosarcina sp. GI1(2024)]